MSTRYKAHHPEHYPIAWLSAAKIAVDKRETDNPWVSVDWARGESGAVSRMKRLRSFRDGLKANRYNYREVAEVIDAGYELTFRKVSFRGVWDVQLAWKQAPDSQQILDAARVAIGEDMRKTS